MGKYRSLGNSFDKTYRNDLNANFDDVDKDIKAVDTKATNALTSATDANKKAEVADGKVNNLQSQVNTLVVNGDSSPAAAQAAVDAKGVDKGNLKQRLDDDYNELSSHLAQLPTQIDVNILDFEYGELELPSDFPHALPFKIFIVDENKIEHDFDINSYKKGAGVVYLDGALTSTIGDGLTPETPKKHLYQALDVAETLPQETVIIYIKDKYYTRNYNGITSQRTLTKNIIFSPYERDHTFIGSFEDPSLLTWTQDGAAYKTTRSATHLILDLAVKFKNNDPTPYKKVNSIAEVQAEEGTFYISGSDVWVRRFGDKAPDDDLMVMLDIGLPSFKIDNKKMVFDRVSWFWFYDNTPSDGLKVTGNANSELVLYKSSFAHAHLNGLASVKVGKVYNIESLAYENGADGFNYHGTMVTNPYEFVYEYYVETFDNGKTGLGNNNGSTAHEGMSILRVGTLAYRCDGPVIADVNGCYSILINCTSHTSTKSGAISKLKSGFYFSDGSGVKQGKALLINCGGGGKDTYSLGTDGVIQLQVRRFKGKNLSPEAESTVEFV